MTELSPYFSRSPALSPKDEHVQPRSGGQGLADLSVSLEKAQQHLSHVRRETAQTQSLLDLSNTMTQTETDWSNYITNISLDEKDIPKAINSFIDNKIKPHYTKLIESTSDPDTRRDMMIRSEEVLRGYRLKGLHYESGVRSSRSLSNVHNIASTGSTALRLDGSDENYKKRVDILLSAIDSSPMDLQTKIKARDEGLSQLAQGQVDHVSFNNPAKFKPFFKMESKPEILLTGKETIAELVDNAPAEIVSLNDNAMATGGPCEGWKHLSEAQKHSVIQRMSNSLTTGKQEERSRVATKLKDIESFLEKGTVPDSIKDSDLSEDNLRQLYGDTRGQVLFSHFQTLINLAPHINQLSVMPLEQAEKELAKIKPDASNLAGAEFKNRLYANVKKTVRSNMEKRKEKPIQWAIDNGLTQDMPEDISEWGAFFVHRRGVSQTMDKLYGVKSPLLSKEEGRKLTAVLDGKESGEVVSHLEAFAEHMGGLNNSAWVETMQNLEHPVIGKAGLLIAHSPEDARDMLRGYKHINRNKGDNIRSEANERFEEWVTKSFTDKFKKAFASLGDHGDAQFDDIKKQVKYHLTGQLLETKAYNFNEAPEKNWVEWLLGQPASAYDKNLEHSFKAIVGNTPVSTGELGSLLIPPRGMSLEDFTNKFTASAKETLKKAGLSERGYGYENAGSDPDGVSHYRVTFGKGYVRDPKTGEPLSIEVYPDLSEEQVMDRMFKDTLPIMEKHKTKTVKQLLVVDK